jgi:hypothetical protein
VKNDWFVQKVKGDLHKEFYNFIRPDWMKNIRVYTQKSTELQLVGNRFVSWFSYELTVNKFFLFFIF